MHTDCRFNTMCRGLRQRGKSVKKGSLFKPIAIGFGVWLPILAVAQVYALIASWFTMPASELLRIPFVNRLFAYVPFLAFLQQVLGVAIVLFLVTAIFFLTGTFVMTWLGKKLRYRVEKHLLSFLPLYKFFKKVVVLFAGENGDVPFLSRFKRSAFVHIYGINGNSTFVSALVTAEFEGDEGISTAYVPAVPNVGAGRIYNVSIEFVHPLATSAGDLLAAVAAWGVGTDKIISRYIAERVASEETSPECFLGEACPLEREVLLVRRRLAGKIHE
ncbi:MAG: hypothetical protein G01um101448_920 [Parcubacteria group bacterium Gr01-1014_48]|nr:MAG: hypothetical protein Greene041614_780 [Parcubacteria group bacterium Greene0416_14]TSC72802.1 MAG: hypothetical protein G01um101448_920 [Parcubacteria group bacterium Gr01-1014_48]TSD00910.1 MAG: hypothetical protein Greene101415_624 [Parcubacteria group bacterium Greene1014_15]TSD07992.1 MAG: hypothetical protein Greene07144_533 [Parcubacteria group bacterium Greene0714_4]